MDNKAETSNIPERKPREKLFEPSDTIDPGTDGWISPDGKYYRCSPDEHDEAAKFIRENDLYVGNAEERGVLIEHDRNRLEFSSARSLLEFHDYILVRAGIGATLIPRSVSTKQLKMLDDSKTPFFNAVRGESVDTDIYEETVKLLRTRVEKLLGSKEMLAAKKEAEESKIRLKFKRVFHDRTLLPEREISKMDAERIAIGLYNEKVEKHNAARRKGEQPKTTKIDTHDDINLFGALNEFRVEPLSGTIGMDSYGDTQRATVEEIFDVVSEGATDTVTIKGSYAESELRILKTRNPHLFLVITLGVYHHRGDAQRYSEPDTIFSVSAKIFKFQDLKRTLASISDGNMDSTLNFGKNNQIITPKDIL